jgi:hypothetical protein
VDVLLSCNDEWPGFSQICESMKFTEQSTPLIEAVVSTFYTDVYESYDISNSLFPASII